MSNEISLVDETMVATPTGQGELLAIPARLANNRVSVYNMINNAESLDKADVKEIHIIGFTQKPDMRNDPTGKNPPAPCTGSTILTAEGNGYFTQSEGIAKSLQTLVWVFGSCDSWPENGYAFTVKATKLPKGTTMKSLVMAE